MKKNDRGNTIIGTKELKNSVVQSYRPIKLLKKQSRLDLDGYFKHLGINHCQALSLKKFIQNNYRRRKKN